MNVSKQTGAVNCALYTMAILAHLALGKDPTTAVFNQDDMRSYLLSIHAISETFQAKRENQ